MEAKAKKIREIKLLIYDMRNQVTRIAFTSNIAYSESINQRVLIATLNDMLSQGLFGKDFEEYIRPLKIPYHVQKAKSKISP